MHPALAALSLEDKGLVLGAALARTAPETLAVRLAGAAGARCGAALAALAGAPKSERAAALAALLTLVRAPVPAGLERIHPGWLRERLERETDEVVRTVTAGLGPEVARVGASVLEARSGDLPAPVRRLAPAAVAELQRIVFAGFVPLAGAGAPPGPNARALLKLTSRALEQEIEARGAETLGRSMRGAPGPIVARAAATLGDRLAGLVVRAAAGAGKAEVRDEARRIVAATGTVAPADTAWELGCRALAIALGQLGEDGPAALIAVAQRLRPERGRRLLALAGIEAL